MKFKHLLIVITGLCFSFSHSDSKTPLNYYHLKFMKEAQEPQAVKMMKIDNISQSKSILTEGVLFTYKDRNAHSVSIAGNFSLWRPRRMERSNHGVWYFYLNGFRKAIRYKYQVDGIWTHDPLNLEKTDDGMGAYVSLAQPPQNSEGTRITYRLVTNQLVEFRLYKPHATMISLVGDFNNWNPENDLLEKDKNGIWRLKKRISPGTYKYKYIIDGDWQTDLYNDNTAYDRNGAACSVIDVK